MRILESVLYAEDLVAAREFYEGILGLDVMSFDPARDLFFRLDGSVLLIFKASRTVVDEGYVPPHGTTGKGHLAFKSTHEEVAGWKDKLTQKGVPITKEIRWKNGAHSIYFEDPAGNVLEFATPDLWGVQ